MIVCNSDIHTHTAHTHKSAFCLNNMLILFLLKVLSEFNKLLGRPEDVEQLPYQHFLHDEFLGLPHKNDVIIEIE